MQAEQVLSLHKDGMPAEDIAREMKLDITLVKSLISNDPEDFSPDERAMAKRVILSVAQGGVDVQPRDQLKAALYIHSGKQKDGSVSISQLQEMILKAKQIHSLYQPKAIDI